MPDTPAPGGSQSFRGLGRASLTLLAGGAAAQALPLLLGPLLTRLFSPVELGVYHLFAAVAANVAVVACARFEFALPLAHDDDEAQALRVLCLRLLLACTVLSGLGAMGWWWAGAGHWVAWLPLAVAVAGALSLATLWATRAQRFAALATARVLQYGGGAGPGGGGVGGLGRPGLGGGAHRGGAGGYPVPALAFEFELASARGRRLFVACIGAQVL
ncbi:hypothetical protein [Ideonella paludis]|uniref:hypothetical protein n=1 Tax=Ideonella paludis TaxID=1233411 RepID=UPI0036446A96